MRECPSDKSEAVSTSFLIALINASPVAVSVGFAILVIKSNTIINPFDTASAQFEALFL